MSFPEDPVDINDILDGDEIREVMGPLDGGAPLVLIAAGDAGDGASLFEALGQYRVDPKICHDLESVHGELRGSGSVAALIIADEAFGDNRDGDLKYLDRLRGGIPMAFLGSSGSPGPGGHPQTWRLVRPLSGPGNAEVIAQLLLGFSTGEMGVPGESTVAPVARGTSAATAPDPLIAVRLLLEQLLDDDREDDVFLRWGKEDPAFLAWGEVAGADGEFNLNVGGDDAASLLRGVADEIEGETAVPEAPESRGDLLLSPSSRGWIALLGLDPGESREALERLRPILRLIEAIDSREGGASGSREVQERFAMLVSARMSALERRRGSLGVVRLEFPASNLESSTLKIVATLRSSDWVEADDRGVWVLLDHPQRGTEEVLSLRLRGQFEDLHGAGIIWSPSAGPTLSRESRLAEAMMLLDRLLSEISTSTDRFRFISP